MGPRCAFDNENGLILNLNEILIRRDAQKCILDQINESKLLLKSGILSSIQPKIGKVFTYIDLEIKKQQILLEARIKIIKECSLVEAEC